MSNHTASPKKNRMPLIIIGAVLVLCLCVGLLSFGAGAYFLMKENTGFALPFANATTALPRIGLGNGAPTPPTNIAPPAFPTITSGGTCDEIAEFEEQGNDHIRPGQSHPPYNSNPPTSGWHWAEPQEWGIYDKPQVQEQLVHNLEHGGIIIQYNGLATGELQRLIDFVKRTPRHIIVAPYPGLPRGVRVAFTAWTYLQNCDGVDLEALADFIDQFRDEGPETVP